MKEKNFFQRVWYVVTFPFLLITKALVYFYKCCISPLLPHMCKFTPSCSTYFLQSVKEYGLVAGIFKGTKRIFRCNPISKGGYDPVIPNIKGKVKWII